MTERWKNISTQFTTSANASVDLSILETLDQISGDNGTSLAQDVVLLYLQIAPGILESIVTHVASSEIPAASKAAHNLKSSSANVGAAHLAELCKEIETQGVQRKAAGSLPSLLADLQNEFSKVRADLELFARVTNGQ